MNSLFVYPPNPDWLWSFKHALRFVKKKTGFPHLGLLTVASLLPPEWNKCLVDMNIQDLTQDDLKWADYVFISAASMQRNSVREIARFCKQTGRKIIAGGPLFTYEWERFHDIDHFIINEAELTLPLLLNDLEAGHAKRVYASREYPDIKKSPIPSWDIARLKQYDIVSVQYSRGCPYNCEFCNVSDLFGHSLRTKTAEQIIAELDSLYTLGWRKDVCFVDDNFVGNKKQIKAEILPALIEWRKGKKGIPFQTFASINLADDEELMGMMYEAGFDCVFVGIETPNEDSLIECNKHQNMNRDLIESIKRIHGAGLRVQGSFIVGFDSDTVSVFQHQINFIQKSGIVAAKVNQLNALYGTRLYERMAQEGRIRTDSTDESEKLESTNIIPKMGTEALQKGYKNLMLHIYSPRPYYERIKTFLRQYKKPRIRGPLELQHILACFRSIYHIGLKGIERSYYWHLMFWTLFRRPDLFPISITFAVYGYHFRKYCERFKCGNSK